VFPAAKASVKQMPYGALDKSISAIIIIIIFYCYSFIRITKLKTPKKKQIIITHTHTHTHRKNLEANNVSISNVTFTEAFTETHRERGR